MNNTRDANRGSSGWTVRALTTTLQDRLWAGIFKNSFCSHSRELTPDSLETWEGEGGEERKWYPISAPLFLVPVGS